MNLLPPVENRMRQLHELALSCGRALQSPQTGFIHYCFQPSDEGTDHTIPLYENTLFAMTLLNSRHGENITEAKSLLEKLLHFQCSIPGPTLGNFPVYLHEYPHASSGHNGVNLLVTLYWIYNDFHHILGKELKERLATALRDLAHFSLEQQLSYPLSLKGAAAIKAVGKILGENDLTEKGNEKWEEFKAYYNDRTLASPAALSELLLAYQLTYPTLSHKEIKPFWEQLTASWHAPSECYCGPVFCEKQDGSEPQVTLYDFFMGYFASKYHYRVFSNHPVQLQASLIRPFEEALPAEISYPIERCGEIDGRAWQLRQEKRWAYSLFSYDSTNKVRESSSMTFMKVVWGDVNRIHSLVCQGGEAEVVRYEAEKNEVSLYFSLAAISLCDDKNQAISFFVDQDESLTLTVDGHRATAFQLGDQITVANKSRKIALTITLHSGDAHFFGHIMKGNRPSQLPLKGSDRFKAYDWQIFLRSVERSSACIIKATLQLSP